MRPEKCGLSGNMLGWVSRLHVASKVTRYSAVAAGLGGAVVVVVTEDAVMGESDPLHLSSRMSAGTRTDNNRLEVMASFSIRRLSHQSKGFLRKREVWGAVAKSTASLFISP